MKQVSHSKSRYFDYLEKQGKLPKKSEDDLSDYAHDGDIEMDYAEELDSSGEPHNEYNLKDRNLMEFMNHGGMVKRIAKGVRAPSSDFARALRKSY